MSNLVNQIFNSGSEALTPVIVTILAVDPNLDEATVKQHLLTWAKAQLGNSFIGRMLDVIAVALINEYFDEAYRAALAHIAGTQNAQAIVAGHGVAS